MTRTLNPWSAAAHWLLWGTFAFTSAASATEGIQTVTVYPDRAQVIREHRAAISGGVGVLRIGDLPARLDPTSVRVRADGPDGLTLHHVETRTLHRRDLSHPEERALSEALQKVRDERQALTDSREAEALKLAFIRRLTETGGGSESGLPPDAWTGAWEQIGQGAAEVLREMSEIDQRARGVDAEIKRLENALDALRTDQRASVEVAVHYRAPSAGSATLVLEYQVPGASWTPVYEARLDTVSGRMEFVQRAEVRQNTGEDWRDVELHVSTARPTLGGRLPELSPWFIGVAPPARSMMREETDALAAMTAPAPMAEATLETTGFTSRYRVPERISLPSDQRQQRFRLGSKGYDARLSARAVPVLSPHVYLFAETTFEGETPLLPGVVTLIQDGQLAGQTRMGTLAPGAPLGLAFGVDDRIEIRREVDRDSLGREVVLRRQHRLDRGYRIEIENRHERPMNVTILDRLPVARDERIQVELSPSDTAPTRQDVDGRPGVLAWDLELDPGASETLDFGYTVVWPEDVEFIHGLQGVGP
jgi:uncharacterized protein (TIGR02231 family)